VTLVVGLVGIFAIYKASRYFYKLTAYEYVYDILSPRIDHKKMAEIDEVAVSRLIGCAFLLRYSFLILLAIGIDLYSPFFGWLGTVLFLVSYPTYHFYLRNFIAMGSHFRKIR